MPDPTTLSEKNRAKLDGIVQKMIGNKESENDINFVVNDFKNKYSEKKNPVSSTSKDTKSELAPKTGSLAGKNTQGFPEIDSNGILPDFDKMKTDVGPTSREAVLRKKLSTTKVTVENMDEVSAATDELSELLKTKHKTQYQNDEKLIQRLNTTDDNRTESDLADEKDDNQVTDYLREGAKNVGNVVGGIVNIFPKAINALSGNNLAIPTIDKFEKKIPLEKQLKQVEKEDPENKLSPQEKQQRAEELFREDSKKEQVKENFNNALTPGVLGVFASDFEEKKALQERLKAHEINKISNLNKEQKANSAQIQLYGGQGLALKKDIENDLAIVKSGKADVNFIQNLTAKQKKYKEVEDKYLTLLDEQVKIKNTKLSVEENIEHFKLDYDPIVKAMDDTIGAFETPIGGALNLMGKTADALRDIPGAKSLDVNDGEKSALSVLGEKLIVDAENRSKSHRAIELENIHSVSDFGSYVTQVFATASPYLLGGIQYQAGKSILGSAAGTGFFMAGSGGKKAYDMDQEMKADPFIDYNNLQYLSAIAGYMGAEKLMLGGYDKIMKGAGATIESIGKNPVERELFEKGIKNYFAKTIEGTGKFISGTNKSGMIGLTTGITRMATDNIALGKKSENPFKEMIDGYVNMAAMHLVMSGPPQIVKTGAYALSKVSEGKAKKQVAENYEKIKRLNEQLQKQDLTETDKNILNSAISLLHQDNQKTIGNSLKKLGTFTRSQVKELLKVDQEKLAIRKQVEALNSIDSGISAENKPELLKGLKAQFEAIEDRKMDVFNNKHNSLNLLPIAEQKKLMAIAKEELYNTSKTDKEGNEVEITEKDIKDKATAIHLEQERFNGMDIKEIEALKKTALKQLNSELTDAQKQKGITISNYEITKRAIENYNKTIVNETETATTPEAQPQAEVQKPSEAEKVETPKPQEVSPVEDVVAPSVEKIKGSDSEIEKRMSEIEDKHNGIPSQFKDEADAKEYNALEKEMEKRERSSVLNIPLENVKDAVDALLKKEKEMPNGFGAFIEKRDARETKEVADKYQGEVNKNEAKKDFKDAFFGNPDTWYADGLKLRESVRVFIEQGGTFKQLLQGIQKEFEQDGFSEQDAAGVIKNKLDKISKANEATPPTNTPTDGNVPIGDKPSDAQGKNDNLPEAVDAKPSEGEVEVNAKEQDEFDNLLSGEAEKRRKDGKYSRDGIEFVRQEKSTGPIGKKDTVKFADKEEVDFEYQLMEAKEVQPSHLNGKRNPDFFITEAQPKNRKDDASKKASDEIGKNPKLKEAGENSNAYSGAPVVNERGEVIQGNNRAEGLKKHYGNNGKSYKEQLKAEAEKYGFTPEQVDGMENPILVRKVAVNDAKAIELGNRDVKDLETGGTRRLDPVTTSRRIPKTVKAKIIDALFRDNSDVTLNKAVRENQGALLGLLKDFMNEAQMESIVRKDGTMRPNGVEDLEKLVQHFLFDGGNVNMPEHFESLSGMAREGVLKSLPKLLSIESAKSIIPELQNAIRAFHAFKQSGVEDFKAWLSQVDMFDEGRTPAEKYSPLEIEIADILHNSKNQKEIKTIFDKYADKTNDFQGDMFEPARKGSDKNEAVKEIFKVENYENKGNDGSGKQEAPVVERGKEGNDGGNNGEPNRNAEGNNDGGGIGEVSNEQNRNNKLARERVQYEKITPKNAPKKLQQIIKDVANGLKSHVIYSRSKRSNTLGSYNPRNTLVRITKAGDIDTVAHELGHLLDDRLNILGTIPAADKVKIDAQLKWYSDRGGSNPPAKYNAAQKAEYLEREGLAEFIRSYVANPSQTKILAPELLAHFEKTIDPKTQTVLTKFSEDYLDFANASGIEKTLSNIEEIDLPNKNKFVEWIKGFRQGDDKLKFTKMDKFYAEMANSNHFGIKAFKALLNIQGKTDLKSHENFEIISRVFLGINGKLENVFSTGMINAKNEKLKAEGGVFDKDSKGRTVYKDGTAMNVKWLIDGLDTTTEESLKKDMGDVIAMAVAERTIEYAKKFERSDNLTGIGGSVETDLTTAVTTLNEFKDLEKTDKAKFDRIQEGVKRYRQMADATLQYAADKGRISKEQLEQIKQGNEYYVALNRNKELEPGEDLFSSFNTGTNGIGAAKEIIKKSKGGTATIENPYLSLLKNMNNIIKEADRNEVMLSFVEPLISTRNMGEGEPVDLSKIGFIANEGDAETIKVFRDGKLEKWKFDKDVYSSLKNIESIAPNPFFTFLSKPSQLIRWTVTHNPVFYARNIVKDTQARMIVSNDHSSFKDMIHNSGDKELFELFGGSQAGHLHTSKESYAKTMQGTIKEITKKGGIVLNPIKWGEKYVKFLQTGENLNRIAEFNNSYKVAREKGMSDYDAGLYAAFQARDLMDFAVAGHTMREINKIVVFSNAGVQSLRKASKSFKNDPAGFAYRTALYSVIPSVAFAALRNAMGDDEEYEDLPDNQRDMFFNFKTPVTGDAWVSIPKPYELGLFSAYVDRGISKIRGNNEAFDGVTGTTMKLLLPFDESSFLGGLKPIIETGFNRDIYTDRSIVPEWESGKLLELRKGTDKASLVGQKMSKLFNEAGWSVDPRKIDHILKGYGTYFANQGMAISDLAKKDRAQLNFWITKTGFAKDIPTYNSKSVKKATDLSVELGKINSGRMKGLRNDIEAFYSETDIKKRKELLNTIYKKSKEISDYYEKEKVKTLGKISKEEE